MSFMNNRSVAPGPGRPYVARFCTCGAEANYAVQVEVRTLGPGSRANRKVRLGKTAVLCGVCVLDPHAYTDQLNDSARDAARRVSQANA